MNVKNIERNGNKATIVVEIDKELMESGVNKAYMKARKQIMVPGFRKGKAPRKMIEAMYGAHVFYEDGLEEIFPEVYQFAVLDQGVKAIGRPSLEDMQISEDNLVSLTLSTEVYPEVTLGQYKGLEIEKAAAEVTDAQVQAELDRMAQNVASSETVERAAEMGDTANIDFEGFDNGVAFEGGKGEGFDLKLGSGQFVPGFEEQVVGMTAGEEKDINITFPEDYKADLAGKAVVFHVKLNKVTVTTLPELDDEFAKDVSEFETLEELKADIRAKALENAEKQLQSAFENAAVEKAAEMGDTANIDFEGFDNGVPFDGGKGDNFDLKLGSGQFVPGFEEQVVGMTAGEEKDINITFPENYTAELAGKAVVFHVKLNKVTVTTVPALDDEFAKDVSEFETLEELKADIRAKALENAEKQAKTAFENAAVEKAAELTTVDMPKALIESELDNQMERFAYQLQMSGYSMEQYAKMMGGDVSTMRNAFRPAAEKQAKINVTLAKIVEVEGITVSDEDMNAEFEALAKQYELEVEKVKEMVEAEEVKASLENRKVVKLIVDSATAVAPKAE